MTTESHQDIETGTVYFVTGNDKKWKETQEILGDHLPLKRISIDLPEVQGATLEEIALWKAQEASRVLNGAAVLTDDTAVCFDALGGLPGAYIKWFLHTLGAEGIPRLLDGFPAEGRGAEAVCTLAFHPGTHGTPLLFQGRMRGTITHVPRGTPPLDCDSIFQPDGEELTYAEMDDESKTTISYRRKALQAFKDHVAHANGSIMQTTKRD